MTDTDSDKVARAVDEINDASTICVLVFALGPAWCIIAGVAGWGFLTWGLGAGVWCFLLFGAVRNVQSLRCPRCRRPWRAPLMQLAQRRWPLQRRCSSCGFDTDRDRV